MATLPSGTVTLLFTDIEGRTRLWEAQPDPMHAALVRHDVLVRSAVEAAGGYVFKTVGDAFCVAFPTAASGLAGCGRSVIASPGGVARARDDPGADGAAHRRVQRTRR